MKVKLFPWEELNHLSAVKKAFKVKSGGAKTKK